MDRHRRLACAGAAALVVAAVAAGCTSPGDEVQTPGLEARGTVLTTVKPVKQDLTNRISLTGKVTINPVFGIVAPAEGELRYVDREPSAVPASRPMWVATVWDDGEPRRVEIPKDSTFAGRLMEDRASVTKGMPIVSARHAGYGVEAEIESALAYRISGATKTIEGQIANGPGPFPCKPLGTIAALPAGTVPEPPPAPEPEPNPSAPVRVVPGGPPAAAVTGSEPTGLRLVCTPPGDVTLINGASVTLSVVTGKADDVWVLPVEAIAGTQGKGKVDVVGPDRSRRTVDVVLGITDGNVVEIKKGLKGDEDIAIPGPNLPTAAPVPGDEPSGMIR